MGSVTFSCMIIHGYLNTQNWLEDELNMIKKEDR